VPGRECREVAVGSIRARTGSSSKFPVLEHSVRSRGSTGRRNGQARFAGERRGGPSKRPFEGAKCKDHGALLEGSSVN